MCYRQSFYASTRSDLADALVEVSARSGMYATVVSDRIIVYGRVSEMDMSTVFDTVDALPVVVTVADIYNNPVSEELYITGLHNNELPEVVRVVDVEVSGDRVKLFTRGTRGTFWSTESGVREWAAGLLSRHQSLPCVATFTLYPNGTEYIIETRTQHRFDVSICKLDA